MKWPLRHSNPFFGEEEQVVILNMVFLIFLSQTCTFDPVFFSAPVQDESASADNAESLADRLNALVPKLRTDGKLVGLAAMAMIDGQVVSVVVDGERRKASAVKLESTDRWHLGSISKSVTATMLGRLIERGTFDWSTTVGECFGESMEVHPEFAKVTIEQLLTHSSGAPANFPVLTSIHHPERDKVVEARRKAVAAVLKLKPETEPGTAYAYSNVGPTIAAAMAEHRTGQSWEDLIRQEVFVPLDLTHAGFGPPQADKTNSDPPRGHKSLGGFKILAGEKADNSPVIWPAGGVHMTLQELCAYGHEHLVGERGEGRLLTAETYKRLHTPRLNGYACGWVVPKKTEWTDGRLIWHNGSNTMWYALLVLLPDQNAVVGITSNDGDIKSAEAAAFRIAQEVATK